MIFFKTFRLPDTIKAQFSLLIVLIVSFVLGGVEVFSQLRTSAELENEFSVLQNIVMTRIVSSLPKTLWELDELTAKNIIKSELLLTDVISIKVFTTDLPFVSVERRLPEASDIVVKESLFHEDINNPLGKQVLGQVQVSFSREKINAALYAKMLQRLIEVVLLISALIAGLVYSLKIVFDPIKRLRDAIFMLAESERAGVEDLAVTGHNELSELIQGFNKVQRKLHTQQDKITQKKLAELNDILLATPSCLKIINSKGELLEMNRQGLLLIEVEDMKSVLRQNVYDIVEESHRAKFIEFNERVCAGNKESLIFEIIGLKGTRRWMESYAAPYPLPGGETAHIAITNDITERKLLEVESVRQSVWKNAILDASRFAIVATNPDGVISTFNRAAEEMFGYKSAEIFGKTPAIFHVFDEVVERAKVLTRELGTPIETGFNAFTAKTIASGSDSNEWTYIRKDRTRFRGRLCITAIFGDNSQPVGFLGIAEDMTAEIELKNTIERERAKANHNAKLASLGEMSAGVAHEINNPLAIISGSVGLLSKFKDNPEKLASKIETIQKSCDRIAKIVNGLKKFSRSSEKNNYLPKSLADIAHEVGILTESESKRHNTPVTFESNTQALIHCDEVEIEQVMINLIHNSIDAVRDQPEKWVKVSIFEDAGSVVLRVRDSGPGIPKQVSEKLFQPFFTTKKVGEGTGLGLSIAKGILDEHKATITVLADVPHTCFEIRFAKAEAVKNAV